MNLAGKTGRSPVDSSKQNVQQVVSAAQETVVQVNCESFSV